ncbi:MAG: hypothetical protein Q9215_002608 [Flavoplaca cf. flavocitrina]
MESEVPGDQTYQTDPAYIAFINLDLRFLYKLRSELDAVIRWKKDVEHPTAPSPPAEPILDRVGSFTDPSPLSDRTFDEYQPLPQLVAGKRPMGDKVVRPTCCHFPTLESTPKRRGNGMQYIKLEPVENQKARCEFAESLTRTAEVVDEVVKAAFGLPWRVQVKSNKTSDGGARPTGQVSRATNHREPVRDGRLVPSEDAGRMQCAMEGLPSQDQVDRILLVPLLTWASFPGVKRYQTIRPDPLYSCQPANVDTEMETLLHKGIRITGKYTIRVYSRGIESGIADEPRRRNLRIEDEPKAEDATIVDNELDKMISAAMEKVFYKLINVDRTPTDLLKCGRAKLQLASQEADGASPTTLLGGAEGAGLRFEDYDDLADNNSGRDDVDDEEGIDYADRIGKAKARKKSRQTAIDKEVVAEGNDGVVNKFNTLYVRDPSSLTKDNRSIEWKRIHYIIDYIIQERTAVVAYTTICAEHTPVIQFQAHYTILQEASSAGHGETLTMLAHMRNLTGTGHISGDMLQLPPRQLPLKLTWMNHSKKVGDLAQLLDCILRRSGEDGAIEAVAIMGYYSNVFTAAGDYLKTADGTGSASESILAHNLDPKFT